MARGYNRIILMGNLARDPEIGILPPNRQWQGLTVAVGRSWRDHDGNQQERTDSSRDVWGNRLKIARSICIKGVLY